MTDRPFAHAPSEPVPSHDADKRTIQEGDETDTTVGMPGVSETANDVVRRGAARLEVAGIPSPRLDAEVLMRHTLDLDRTAYFLVRRDPLSPEARHAFEERVHRRLSGEPVAYITGTREFMGLPFAVSPAVLVPRPETELLVEWARAWLNDRSKSVVIDVGTGSGAIVLSVAARLDPSRGDVLIGADISDPALDIARRNRIRLAEHGEVASVHLVRGDLTRWCRGGVDLLLANLPYLRPDQFAGNPDLHAEPELALVAGDDGLALIRLVVADLRSLLSPGGAIGLEIDPSQAETVSQLLREALPDPQVMVRHDLAGLARHIIAYRGSRNAAESTEERG